MALPVSSVDRYAPTLLFIILEIISFVLIINFNQKQGEIFLHSSSLLSGSMVDKVSKIRDFANLQQSNQDLLRENARLLDEIINSPPRDQASRQDTALDVFDVIPVRVISNSITSIRNIITLDKGLNDGLQPKYGLLSNDGVVGIVNRSSSHYSTAISLLNIDCNISARIRGLDYFGKVSWQGRDYKKLLLSEIPIHASVKLGDEIITSGYSSIFPADILIGTVSGFKVSKDGAFYDIDCVPAVDFAKLKHIYAIKNNFITERDSLLR